MNSSIVCYCHNGAVDIVQHGTSLKRSDYKEELFTSWVKIEPL